jgi:hypothetical protein
MAKPIERDGKFYRMRRGKEVEIPPEWLGKVTSRQTINKRASRQTRQQRDAKMPAKLKFQDRLEHEHLDESEYKE